MARRRAHPAPARPITPEGRVIARAIREGQRRGETQQQIGVRLGMNERTVRKILSGETPGTRLYAEKVPPPKKAGTTPNIMRANMDLGDGMIRSRNVKLPNVMGANGKLRPPTPYDVYRFPDLNAIVDAEARAMQRRYEMQNAQSPIFVGLTRVENRRAKKLIRIAGTAARA